MKIELSKLEIKNFKGIKELEVNFGSTTNIFGENATGKTTVKDAFLWLLFNKNSEDKAAFGIKPIDPTGSIIHNLESEVSAVLVVEGKEIYLKKIFREVWTRHKGSESKTFDKNTTDYFINDVPVSKKDYTEFISKTFNEEAFKLLTSPNVFTNLHWTKQREILLKLIGGFDNDTVYNTDDGLKELKTLIGDNGFEKFKKEVASKKRNLNEELKKIPIRIDEAHNGITTGADYASLNKELEALETKYMDVEAKIINASKISESELKLKEARLDAKYKAKQIKESVANRYNNKNKDFKSKQLDIIRKKESFQKDIDHKDLDIERIRKSDTNLIAKNKKYEAENDIARQEFTEIKAREFVFNEELGICPTCKQKLPSEEIEELRNKMQTNFINQQKKELEGIRNGGKHRNEVIEENAKELEANEINKQVLAKEMQELQNQINDLEIEYKSIVLISDTDMDKMVKKELDKNMEYQRYLSDSEELLPMENLSTTDDSLNVKRTELNVKIKEIKELLLTETANKKLQKRIKELEKLEKTYSEQLAELEGQEYLCEQFIRTKVDLLNKQINSKFELVSFKLFNTLVNGGLEETCEVTVNGVPYSDVNSAHKINAGLDIIKTLSNFYDMEFPIFIDNREGVNEIINMDTQIINLIVSKDEKLKVEVAK